MDKTIFKWLTPVWLTVAAVSLGGCQKIDGIDFDDIDSTVGLEFRDFKLPTNNSTHEISLDEVFSIDTTGCVKIDPRDGHYFFYQNGEESGVSTIHVSPITVTSSEGDFSPNLFELTFEDLGILRPDLARGKAPQMKQVRKTIQTFDILEDGLYGDVVSLTEALVNRTSVRLTLTFSNDLAAVISEIAELTAVLPDYLLLREGGVRVLQNSQRVTMDGNDIRFERVMTSEPLVFEVAVEGLRFSEGGRPDDANYLAYSRYSDSDGTMFGQVRMKGQVEALVKFDQSTVVTDPAVLRHDMSFRIDSHLEFGAVQFQTVTGEFRPDVDLKVGSVTIDNVPSFLDDPDVVLNISDPIIQLHIWSNLPLTGLIDGTLTSYFSDGTTRSVVVRGIEVKPNQTSDIVISRRPRSEAAYADYQKIVQDDLSTLLSSIPDRIDFTCSATTRTGEQATILLGHSYAFEPSYEFRADLALGRDSYISYTDSITGWAGDLEDVDLYDARSAKVQIEADVTNTIPAELTLDIIPVDIDGNPVRGMAVNIDNGQGQNKVAAKGQTHLTATLTFSTADAFRQLDGIRLKAAARVTDEFTLNSGATGDTTHHLKIDNLGATLNATVIVNTDDDDH